MVKYSRVDTVGEERSERKRIMKERKEFGARISTAYWADESPKTQPMAMNVVSKMKQNCENL